MTARSSAGSPYSFSWGANFDFHNVLAIGSATGGGGAGKVTVHDISVTKHTDSSSPG